MNDYKYHYLFTTFVSTLPISEKKHVTLSKIREVYPDRDRGVLFFLPLAQKPNSGRYSGSSNFYRHFAEDENLKTADDWTTFFGLPALSLSNILSALSGLAVNYMSGNFGNSAVKASVININPYPTAFPYGNGMVLHFYQQQESSTTKTVHKVINKRLKTYV